MTFNQETGTVDLRKEVVDKIIRDLKFLPSNEGLYFRSDEMNLLSEWNCVLLQYLDGLSLFYCEKGDFYD